MEALSREPKVSDRRVLLRRALRTGAVAALAVAVLHAHHFVDEIERELFLQGGVENAPLWLLALVGTALALATAEIHLAFEARMATLLTALLLAATFGIHACLFVLRGYWLPATPLVLSFIAAFVIVFWSVRGPAPRALGGPALGERDLVSSMMNAVTDGVIVADVTGAVHVMNPKARDILGIRDEAEPAAERSAIEILEGFEGLSPGVLPDKLRGVVERAEPFTSEIRIGGSSRPLGLYLGPVKSAEGAVRGMVVVLSDVKELRSVDGATSELMSMVAHEIRTPLATVRGFAQILRHGGMEEGKSREFLEIIHRQAERVLNLVNDFLDITRIEARRHRLERGPLDLARLVRHAVADLRPLAEEKQIDLRYLEPASAPPLALGDRNLIEQVLINLVSNAIKYSPTGAKADVALFRENGRVAVSVRDTGLGIPEESLPRLFDKFYRVRCDDRRDIIGTGLGLSLVKQILDVHHGTIRVESVHGSGSTVTFTLPCAAPGPGSAPDWSTAASSESSGELEPVAAGAEREGEMGA